MSWYIMFDEMRGFSLLEVLVVIVVLAVIAAMAVARYGELTARTREKAQVHRLRAINDAQKAFFLRAGRFGDLSELRDAELLNDSVAVFGSAGEQIPIGGYLVEVEVDGVTYSAYVRRQGGGRVYCTDESAVIKKFSDNECREVVSE